MAEPTLSLGLGGLYAIVALERGYDTVQANWVNNQQAIADEIVKSALDMFYHPEPLEDGGPAYDWSFLKPVATFQLAQGQNTMQLPDDFGGFEGSVIVSVPNSGSSYPWELRPTHIGYINSAYALDPTETGPPSMLAESPIKGSTPAGSARSNLVVFPIPDQAYLLQAQYYFNPDYLTQANPYTVAGAEHSQTIRAAVRAASEQFDGQQGTHTEVFFRRLASSISADRRHKPIQLKRNLDRSDQNIEEAWPYPFMHGYGPHTYIPPPPGF